MQKTQEPFSVTLRVMSQFFNWLGGCPRIEAVARES